jgi:hypothetical protein
MIASYLNVWWGLQENLIYDPFDIPNCTEARRNEREMEVFH